MSLLDDLKALYPELIEWSITKGEYREKERINQSTETIEFIAVSPDEKMERRFIYTNFTDHRGSKKSWKEVV